MMSQHGDWRLVGPGVSIVAISYGLARYAYGLFLPEFRTTFELSDQSLAVAGSLSYAAYVVVTLIGIWLSAHIDPRKALIAGGLAAASGMLMIAIAQTPAALFFGVALAGVSPGLAYTPFPAIIPQMVSARRRYTVYAIINSGTSLGVMLSGPLALGLPQSWRTIWAFFSVLAVASTIWAGMVIPAVKAPQPGVTKISLSTIVGERGRLLVLALFIGVATSIYWTFSVDLVASKDDSFGEMASFSKVFWTIVGLAGFAGMAAGVVIRLLGMRLALFFFQSCIAIAMLLLSTTSAPVAIIVSGLIFGASFVFMAATLGLWSMDIFGTDATIGFGLTFLSLSIGQFVGPLSIAVLLRYVDLGMIFKFGAILSIGSLILIRRKERTHRP